MGMSPISAIIRDSNGAAPVALLYGRSIQDSALICLGPRLQTVNNMLLTKHVCNTDILTAELDVTDVLWRCCVTITTMRQLSPYCTNETILQITYRVPDRFDAPESNGIPTKQASNPSAVLWTGSLIIDAIPPERGMSFGLVGKLKALFKRLHTENWRTCTDGLSLIRLSGLEPTKKRKTLLCPFMFYVLSPALEEQQNSDCPGEGLERAWTSDYELGWGGGTNCRCERGQIIIKGSLTAQGFHIISGFPIPSGFFVNSQQKIHIEIR